jgi:DNA-binding NarL/FixJ family response regulator
MNDLVKAAMTGAEGGIAEALLEGLPNKEIGKRLGISHLTVKQRMRMLFIKFQIENHDGRGGPGKRIILARKLMSL